MKTRENVVLITGGSSGIGLALAEAFSARENIVIVCGRDPEKLDAAKAQLPDLQAVVCDVSDLDQVSALVKWLRDGFGSLDVLVNNAGIQYQYPKFHAAADALPHIEQEIAVNLTAAVRLTYLLLPLLLRPPAAAVVNVSSALALVPRMDVPVYCATKAGLHAFTRALRRQLKDTPVRVFEVLPPEVDTGMVADSTGDKIAPEVVAQAVISAIEHDRYEVHVGLVRTLALINQFLPGVAEYLVHN